MRGLSKEGAMRYLESLLRDAPIRSGCGKMVNSEVFRKMYMDAKKDPLYDTNAVCSKRILHDLFQTWYNSRLNK